MFDLDIKVSSNEYFDLIRKLECLTSENEHLKGLNKNQMNTIIDLRNEITDLKKQNGDLCELVGKTKSENAACRIENYRLRRKLDNGCNTCPDMENTKKKNDELRELIDFKRKQIEEQANTIRDLDKKLAELRAGAKDLQEQNQILKDKLRSMCENCDVPDNCVNASEAVLKDADDKIDELKKNHEVAMNNQRETYRAELKRREDDIREYRKANCTLRKQLEDARFLYNALIKELARKGETNGNANSD